MNRNRKTTVVGTVRNFKINESNIRNKFNSEGN